MEENGVAAGVDAWVAAEVDEWAVAEPTAAGVPLKQKYNNVTMLVNPSLFAREYFSSCFNSTRRSRQGHSKHFSGFI